MLELDKEIDDAFIKKVLIKEKPFNINRASRSKNVWSFTIMGTEAESTSVLNKMKTEPNVLAISTVSLNLNNTQSKSKDMKKVKPTTKQ